jgi:hypothetical protein
MRPVTYERVQYLRKSTHVQEEEGSIMTIQIIRSTAQTIFQGSILIMSSHFGTHCPFHLQGRVIMRLGLRMLGYLYRLEKVWLEKFRAKPFPV